MIEAREVFPGVHHLTDAMGVSMTLLQGAGRAMLFDTGYGLENVRERVLELTDREVDVVLSHGHHDHILGARWFGRTYLSEEDLEEYRLRTGRAQREKVAAQAAGKGLTVPGDFLTAVWPEPVALKMGERICGFESLCSDLGDLKITLMKVPGHTPGSLILYIEKWGLMLTADNWNPCTWLWFPSAVPARIWRENMKRVMAAFPVRWVLCSHDGRLFSRDTVDRYLQALTDEKMNQAERVRLDERIDTRQVSLEREGMRFVFDWRKFRR